MPEPGAQEEEPSPPESTEEPWLRPLESLLGLCAGGGVAILAPGSEELVERVRGTGDGGIATAAPRGLAAAAGRIALLRGLPPPGQAPPPAPLYVRPPDALAGRS